MTVSQKDKLNSFQVLVLQGGLKAHRAVSTMLKVNTCSALYQPYLACCILHHRIFSHAPGAPPESQGVAARQPHAPDATLAQNIQF